MRIGGLAATVPTSSRNTTGVAKRNSNVLVGCKNSATGSSSTSFSATTAADSIANEHISTESGPLSLNINRYAREKGTVHDYCSKTRKITKISGANHRQKKTSKV